MLDFDLMREHLGFPPGVPILEHLETLSDPEQIVRCERIIDEHERKGAEVSTPMPGIEELLAKIRERKCPIGVLTRNSKHVTEITFDKLGLKFDIVLTRDDCLPKPDPDGLHIIANKWGMSPERCVYVGDFQFDIEVAKNAGMMSALYVSDKNQHFAHEADYQIRHYDQWTQLLL